MAELHLTDAQLVTLVGYLDGRLGGIPATVHHEDPLITALVTLKHAADEVLLAEQARRRGML